MDLNKTAFRIVQSFTEDHEETARTIAPVAPVKLATRCEQRFSLPNVEKRLQKKQSRPDGMAA